LNNPVSAADNAALSVCVQLQIFVYRSDRTVIVAPMGRQRPQAAKGFSWEKLSKIFDF
jgi:hypothetical protein